MSSARNYKALFRIFLFKHDRMTFYTETKRFNKLLSITLKIILIEFKSKHLTDINDNNMYLKNSYAVMFLKHTWKI